MQAVGVLVGIDALERCVLVEVLGQRQLHDVSGALGVGVEFVDGGVELLLRDVGRQVAAEELMPTLAQSLCLPRTYAADPGSSPTRMVPSPGVIPAAFSAFTRTFRSSKISSRVALPSRIVAVTATIVPG